MVQDHRVHRLRAFGSLLLVSLLGVPAYFIAFLIAYGFKGSVGVGSHVVFLVLVGLFAVLAGQISAGGESEDSPDPTSSSRMKFGFRASVSLNAAAVGVGSIVSAQHKDENSVSQGFSTTTDVLVASGLFAIALVAGLLALRVDFGDEQGTAP